MHQKKCPECGKTSQTTIMPNKWTCPYCSYDLTNIKTQSAKELELSKSSGGIERDAGSSCEDGLCPVK